MPRPPSAVQLYWDRHIAAMRAAGFTNSTQLYVACGLLSYNNTLGWEQAAASILRQGLASEVHGKEQLLPQEELEGG